MDVDKKEESACEEKEEVPYYPMLAVFYQPENTDAESLIQFLLTEGYAPLVYGGGNIPPVENVHTQGGYFVGAGETEVKDAHLYQSEHLYVLIWWAQRLPLKRTEEMKEFFTKLIFDREVGTVSDEISNLKYCAPVPINTPLKSSTKLLPTEIVCEAVIPKDYALDVCEKGFGSKGEFK